MRKALELVTARRDELKAAVGNRKVRAKGTELAKYSKWDCFMLGLDLAIETIEDGIKEIIEAAEKEVDDETQ